MVAHTEKARTREELCSTREAANSKLSWAWIIKSNFKHPAHRMTLLVKVKASLYHFHPKRSFQSYSKLSWVTVSFKDPAMVEVERTHTKRGREKHLSAE